MTSHSQKIAVIGAGVIGLCTARALAERGQEVILIERGTRVAEICSYANAGLLTLAHAQAWANPSIFSTMARAFLGRHPSIKISKFHDPALWRWGLQFLRQSSAGKARANSQKLLALAEHSLGLMQKDADFEFPANGAFYFFDDQKSYASTLHPKAGIVGIKAGAALKIDPYLPIENQSLIVHSAKDFSANCNMFCQALAQKLERMSQVQIRLNEEARGFIFERGKICGLQTNQDQIPCDQIILATGVQSHSLLNPLGLKLPIYPVKGYASSWKITDPQKLPKHPYIDEARFVAVSNFGDILRVTSIAEFAGFDTGISDEIKAQFGDYVRENFAGSVDLSTPQFWAGHRPATPSTLPYIGALEAHPNLWVNAGHGQLGWTLAYGAADILAAKLTHQKSPLAQGVSARARKFKGL